MNDQRFRKLLDAILVPLLAVLSGLVVMGILILILRKPLFESYAILFSKGFGCEAYGNCIFITALERATPLILTGLSAVVAFRSGMFSIGQEGQYLLGAAVAAWLGYAIHLPPVIHALVLILAAMLVGAAYGYPLIRQYTTETSHTVELADGRRLQYGNSNRLVNNAGWDIGVSKTGYISEAGRCLVMQARIAAKPMIIVLLDSWGRLTRIGDANRIKRWIESQLARQPAG